jgi:hypothetical protein
LTGLNTILNAGSSYLAQVQFGTCGGNYYGSGTAWIDFDQNGVFDATEVIGTWTGTPPTALSNFNFTVPAGAANGTTRMRVTQQEGASLPLDPCASFAWGSVMDFSITIGNGIDCSGYIGDDTTDPIIVSTLPYTGNGDNSFCYSNQNLVYNSPDIYYKLNPSPLMGSITVSLCGSTFDTFLSVIDGAGNVIAYNDDAPGCGTTSELTFPTDGLGLVYVIVEGWGNASGAYDISINANYLGQTEMQLDSPNIYPNPASELIMINNVSGDITIHDISGKIVYSITEYEGEQISISHLNKGVYTVDFVFNGNKVTKRFIKE